MAPRRAGRDVAVARLCGTPTRGRVSVPPRCARAQDNATMLKGQLEQQTKAVDTIVGNMRMLENKLAEVCAERSCRERATCDAGWQLCAGHLIAPPTPQRRPR